jgi:LacI family transcriptional regulator, galactose operon repressor
MTLQDVAKRARVSPATVSRVLNNTGRVKETTRSRVLKAVEAVGYQPNIHARTLAHGRSQTLGMIVSNLRNPFFLDIFQTLESDAHEGGYEVVVANTDYDPRQLLKQVGLMRGRRLAGLAVIVSEMEPTLIKKLADSTTPIVFYDVGVPSHHCTNIKTNYAKATRKVVEYLYSLGHRRLGFVGHHTGLEPLHTRHRSFIEAVEKCCDGLEHAMAADTDSPLGGQSAARQLFASGFKPTAVVCCNDFMALGVLKAVREMGLSVPEDVSVVGCDNISLAEFACPPLTTINVPRDTIGHLVSQALIPGDDASRLWGREIPIEPELIIRDTTGPAPASRR